MRGDILVKIFAGVLFASGAVVAVLIWVLWETFIGPMAAGYPIYAILGTATAFILSGPQIIASVLAWRFGSVARAMALDETARAREHVALRVFIGLLGLMLLGIISFGGLFLALDFGFSGLCGIVLVILAAVGPRKVAGV
jgi:hypothetical protein